MSEERDRASASLLPAAEVATLTGLSIHAVRKRAHRGRAWRVRKGREWLFWREYWESQAAKEERAALEGPP